MAITKVWLVVSVCVTAVVAVDLPQHWHQADYCAGHYFSGLVVVVAVQYVADTARNRYTADIVDGSEEHPARIGNDKCTPQVRGC